MKCPGQADILSLFLVERCGEWVQVPRGRWDKGGNTTLSLTRPEPQCGEMDRGGQSRNR